MALYVLGDTHLSLGASKPMDIFPGWDNYVERLERSWRKLITPQDTIVLAGDISWAMRLTIPAGTSRICSSFRARSSS